MAGESSNPSPADGDGPGDTPRADSLIESVQALLRELPGLVSDRVELFALELTRAGHALARVVAWVVVIAILGVTAWLTLWAGVALALVELGLRWPWALLMVLVVNLLAVLFAVGQVRRFAARLGLPATRRHLTFAAEPLSPSDAPLADDHEPARAP